MKSHNSYKCPKLIKVMIETKDKLNSKYKLRTGHVLTIGEDRIGELAKNGTSYIGEVVTISTGDFQRVEAIKKNHRQMDLDNIFKELFKRGDYNELDNGKDAYVFMKTGKTHIIAGPIEGRDFFDSAVLENLPQVKNKSNEDGLVKKIIS